MDTELIDKWMERRQVMSASVDHLVDDLTALWNADGSDGYARWRRRVGDDGASSEGEKREAKEREQEDVAPRFGSISTAALCKMRQSDWISPPRSTTHTPRPK